MQTQAVELNNVIYNAASQSFEALVTVYAETSSRSFACAINAPINMTFEDAAQGLSTQALRRFNGHNFHGRVGLSSTHPANTSTPQVRAGRTQPRKVMDAFDILRRLAA